MLLSRRMRSSSKSDSGADKKCSRLTALPVVGSYGNGLEERVSGIAEGIPLAGEDARISVLSTVTSFGSSPSSRALC